MGYDAGHADQNASLPVPRPKPQPEMARKPADVWLAENREALESSNAYVATHGLPLARYCNFLNA